MNIRAEFIKWIENKGVYKVKPLGVYIDKYIEFLGYDPFSFDDDCVDVDSVINIIEKGRDNWKILRNMSDMMMQKAMESRAPFLANRISFNI